MSDRLRRTGPWLLVGLVLFALATAQVALANQRLQTAVQTSRLQGEVRRASDDVSRLKIELSMLSRPDRLRAVALDRLGMRPPTAAQVVHP